MVESDSLGITLNIYMFLFTIIFVIPEFSYIPVIPEFSYILSSPNSLIGDMVLQLKYGTRAPADEHSGIVFHLFYGARGHYSIKMRNPGFLNYSGAHFFK